MLENEMVIIVGINTKRTYVEGRRADCHKYLLTNFPRQSSTAYKHAKVFDEPLKVVRKGR